MKKSTENATPLTEEKATYNVVVTRAHEIKEGRVVFDAKVNDVHVTGLMYVEYKNAKGEEGVMLSMPQEEYKDAEGKKKYRNKVWFPISKELKENIIEQLEKLV